MNEVYLYGVQVLFIGGIAAGSHILNSQDILKWLNVARYVIYFLTIHGVPAICKTATQLQTKRWLNFTKVAAEAKSYLLLYFGSVAVLVYFNQSLFEVDFVYVFLAYLVVKYPEMAAKQSINYGVGMACSYFEGYLIHILPSDGAKFVGFEENITALEDQQGVLFPVKKLFIIITKSLYCPPDLKEFNRGKDVPHLEVFNSLDDVVKSVAGTKDRTYRNTAYKIYRPPAAAGAPPPVCLAAECATPLHTLHKVLNNRTLYNEVADIDVDVVVSDFCTTLRSVMDKSPQCRGKCELIFYDHEDPTQNLAEILLDRIRELEPSFEQKIIDRRNQNLPDADA